jgi:hypothetical protein
MRGYRQRAMLESGQIVRKDLKDDPDAGIEPETETIDEVKLNVLSLCFHVARNMKPPLRVLYRDPR